MAATVSSLVPILAPLATLTVGLIAGLIAYQQWIVSKNKLKLDLFDRRYKNYMAFNKFLTTLLFKQTYEESELLEFYAGTADSNFLFGSEINDYRGEVSARGGSFVSSLKALRLENDPVKKDKFRQQFDHDLRWLVDQMPNLQKRFEPYLSYKKLSETSIFDKLYELAKMERKSENVV